MKENTNEQAKATDIELTEIRDGLFRIFRTDSVDELGKNMMKDILSHDEKTMSAVIELFGADLSTDYLQSVWQYYQADRKEKKQDFTPKTLASLMGRLVEKEEEVIDLCAGSGALAIQAWHHDPNKRFTCYELDKKVIPYLLFNLAIRNMSARVIVGDALQNIKTAEYYVTPSERFSEVKYIDQSIIESAI